MARAKGIPALELYRLAQKKKRKLVLCGHSLGGAVSIFLHFIVILTIWFLFICFFLLLWNHKLYHLFNRRWQHWPR